MIDWDGPAQAWPLSAPLATPHCIPQLLQSSRGSSIGPATTVHLEQNKRSLHVADPAPGSLNLLDDALVASAPSARLPAAAAPPPPTPAAGRYSIGARVPAGLLRDGAVQHAGVFALPIDPLSGYCWDGGYPVGFGYDTPGPVSVRCSAPCFAVQIAPCEHAHMITNHHAPRKRALLRILVCALLRRAAVRFAIAPVRSARCICALCRFPTASREARPSADHRRRTDCVAMQGQLALTCLLEAPASECTPNGTLSAARYLEHAYVAPTPGAPPSVTPVVTSVRFASGAPAPMPGGAPPPAELRGGSCDNALQEVAYTVLTSAPGVVESVAADVVVTDAPIGAGDRVSVRRAFSVRFRATGASVRAAACPNLRTTREAHGGHVPRVCAIPARQQSSTHTRFRAHPSPPPRCRSRRSP